MPNYQTINLTVNHANLSTSDGVTAITDTVDALKCKFNFVSAEWSDFSKTAVFTKKAGVVTNTYTVLLGSDGVCSVPYEVLTSDGSFNVGVYGVYGAQRLPTNFINVTIADGCYTEGAEPGEPTADIYSQILAAVSAAQTAAESVRTDADNGEFDGATGATGATGAKGATGATGAAGQAATVTVGTVTTGEPGTQAAVSNSGSTSAAVLDFTLPKGAKGDTGTTGATGAAGQAATVTVGTVTTGEPGTQASVVNSGSTSAAVLDFTLPKGAKGDTGAAGATGATGATGAAGQAATVTVGTVTTGEPGTQAAVSNSGSTSAAVLNFTIPKGSKGDTGAAGASYTLPAATSAVLGGVKVGTGLSIDVNGVLSVSYSNGDGVSY